MVYIVKETLNVGLQHIVDLFRHNGLVDVPHHIVRALAGAESIGAFQKARLINFVQHFSHYALHQPVFIGRYSQWPQFPIGLGNIRPPHRARFILKFPHPLYQRRDSLRGIFVIGCFVYSVYAGCLFPALLSMLRHQCPLVYIVHEILHRRILC